MDIIALIVIMFGFLVVFGSMYRIGYKQGVSDVLHDPQRAIKRLNQMDGGDES